MPKGGKKSHWWHRFRFQYKLSIVNDLKLEEVFFMRISWMTVTLWGFALFVVVTLLVSTLIVLTPLKNLLPGYLDVKARRDIVNQAMMLDSLESKSALYDNYLEGVKKIISGDVVVDSVNSVENLIEVSEEDLAPTAEELAFRKNFENNSIASIVDREVPQGVGGAKVEVRLLPSPVKGVLTERFSPAQGRFGVTLSVKKGEAIKSLLPGRVVGIDELSSGGYSVAIQSPKGVITQYKYCAKVIVVPGKEISANDCIGFTSDSGQKGEEVRFELLIWQNGTPVNPESVIVF